MPSVAGQFRFINKAPDLLLDVAFGLAIIGPLLCILNDPNIPVLLKICLPVKAVTLAKSLSSVSFGTLANARFVGANSVNGPPGKKEEIAITK